MATLPVLAALVAPKWPEAVGEEEHRERKKKGGLVRENDANRIKTRDEDLRGSKESNEKGGRPEVKGRPKEKKETLFKNQLCLVRQTNGTLPL